MYGLDANQTFEFLEGGRLVQLCVGENELIFRFEGDVTLVVESDLRLHDGEKDHLCSSSVEAARAALGLVGDRIKSAHSLPPGTLRLEFDSARWIEIYDSSSEFESYQLTWQHGAIVV